MEPLIGVDQVAERCAISRRTVWELVRSGRIPHVRIGRSVRFDREQLERWIRSRSSGAAEGAGAGAREEEPQSAA